MEEANALTGMSCTKCGEFRLLSVFRIRAGKLKQPCKKCYLEYGRRHYQNNKQYYLDKAKRYNDVLWEKTRLLVWAYLKCHPCVDCGIADPRVLDFDHVRGVKKHNVSDLKSMHFCWKVIQEEIAMCAAQTATALRTIILFRGEHTTGLRSSVD